MNQSPILQKFFSRVRGRRASYVEEMYPEKAYEFFLEAGGNMEAARQKYIAAYNSVSKTKFMSIYRFYILQNPDKCKTELNDMFKKNYQYNAVFSDNEWERYLVACVRGLATYYYNNNAKAKKSNPNFLLEKTFELADKLGFAELCKKHIGTR